MKPLQLALLFVLLLPTAVAAQRAILPCEEPNIAVAADGSGVWFVCFRNLAAIRKAREHGQPPPAAYETPTDLYWLDTATHVPVKIASANAIIRVLAAPSGSLTLVVMPRQTGSSRVLLYNRKQELKELPLDDTFLLWSSDARRLYFYGGRTVQADAWNILGIYDLDKNTSNRAKLIEPTEILGVCPATGNVYSTTPQYPGFAGSTVEYTPTIQYHSCPN